MNGRELTLAEPESSARHPVGEQGRGSQNDYDRFYAKVRLDPSTGCWLWTGTRYTHRGVETYGQFWLQKRRMGAHIASYILHHGPQVKGLDVMHSCNVKPCVNPAHLSQGTRSQNLLDGFRDNPGVCAGENNGRAKLDWPRVRAIRAAAASGVSHVELSRRYGVTPSAISLIVRGRKWPEPVAEQGEVAA